MMTMMMIMMMMMMMMMMVNSRPILHRQGFHKLAHACKAHRVQKLKIQDTYQPCGLVSQLASLDALANLTHLEIHGKGMTDAEV
jgi:hypothetical protein